MKIYGTRPAVDCTRPRDDEGRNLCVEQTGRQPWPDGRLAAQSIGSRVKASLAALARAVPAMAAGFALSALALTAEAVVLDFESLAVQDDLVHEHSSTYSEDGFTFNSLTAAHDGSLTEPYGFASFGTGHPSFVGSTGLFNNNTDAWTELVREGGGEFTLRSVDLAELWPLCLPCGEASFLGFFANGDAVIESFSFDNVFGAQTFQFIGFTNVVRVLTPSCCMSFALLDNFVIDGGESTVPTPSTISLLLVALGGLGAIARRDPARTVSRIGLKAD